MARYRKASPIRDNLPGILAGAVCSLLVFLLIWAAPRVGPAVKGVLAGLNDRPPAEGAAQEPPSGESAPPAEEEAPTEGDGASPEGAEAQTLGDRLLAACRKFWPVLPVFIVVMEAVEYVGKFFIWVRKLLR